MYRAIHTSVAEHYGEGGGKAPTNHRYTVVSTPGQAALYERGRNRDTCQMETCQKGFISVIVSILISQ